MTKLSIFSVGAFSAVGLSAEQTAFGLRAGIFCPRTIGHEDKHGQKLGAVLVPAIQEEIEGWERLVSLALPALREVFRPLGGKERIARIFLALPEPRPGLSAEDHDRIINELVDAQLDGDQRMITKITGDREAFAAALVAAKAYVETNREDLVLVGAVDSYHDLRTYRALDDDYRILSERSPNGFIPGEGCAFVALGARGNGLTEIAQISFVALGNEPSEDDVLAEVWTDITRKAVRSARNTLESRGQTVGAPWILVDQDMERHRSKAWQTVVHRLREQFDRESIHQEALARRLGDVGAASGAILAVYATIGLASGFAPGPLALVALASDRTPRASFSIIAPRR